MKERFKAKNPRSMMLRFHTQTGGSTLTAQQPDNNVVRVTLQALAAVLGGTQSLHTNSRDEALALPTEESVRIALRTQQIIACESGVADTVDPLAGSYYIENLTNEIEVAAWSQIQKIDALGGAIAAIEKGYMQREIQESAYDWQMQVERKERIVVGVNQFHVKEDALRGLLRVDATVGEKQVQRLQVLRSQRDNQQVRVALAQLETDAKSTANIMPSLIEAVRAYATLGEICNCLRNIFGEYHADNLL